MTAAAPLSCGATKLVPPQPVSSGLPWKPVKYSSKPVNGSALVDRSGTPRPSREIPDTAAGCGWKIHADGSSDGPNFLGTAGSSHSSPRNRVIPGMAFWYPGIGSSWLYPPPPPPALANANDASDFPWRVLKYGHSQSQPQARSCGIRAETVLDSGIRPGSVVPPAEVVHALSPGLSTFRSVLPSSSASSKAPASPWATKLLWPCASSSRKARSVAAWKAGVSWCAPIAVSMTSSASPQLVDTVSATFSLAAWKYASAKPASEFGAW